MKNENTQEFRDLYMWDADGQIRGQIIRLHAKDCRMGCCLSECASVRWPDGKLTYPCMSMVKQVSETEYQICRSRFDLTRVGLFIKDNHESVQKKSSD